MNQTQSRFGRTLVASLLVAVVVMICGGIFNKSQTDTSANNAFGTTQDSFYAYCDYDPNWSVFKAGKQKVNHSGSGIGFDTYIIHLPRVDHRTTTYPEIQLKVGDLVVVSACGCVQSGGKGDTWKRYVDPSGDDSDRLYHGVMVLENFSIIPPAVSGLKPPPPSCCIASATMKDVARAVRIGDIIAAQNRGYQFQVSRPTNLVLGYEDGTNDYGDNGYSDHDDGTDAQCRGVGAASVRVVITHKTN